VIFRLRKHRQTTEDSIVGTFWPRRHMLPRCLERLLPWGTSFYHLEWPLWPNTGCDSEVGMSMSLTSLNLILARKGTNERGPLQVKELRLRHLGSTSISGMTSILVNAFVFFPWSILSLPSLAATGFQLLHPGSLLKGADHSTLCFFCLLGWNFTRNYKCPFFDP
jgi:hypothetical protein